MERIDNKEKINDFILDQMNKIAMQAEKALSNGNVLQYRTLIKIFLDLTKEADMKSTKITVDIIDDDVIDQALEEIEND